MSYSEPEEAKLPTHGQETYQPLGVPRLTAQELSTMTILWKGVLSHDFAVAKVVQRASAGRAQYCCSGIRQSPRCPGHEEGLLLLA